MKKTFIQHRLRWGALLLLVALPGVPAHARAHHTDAWARDRFAAAERMREALGLGKRSESVAHPQQNHTPHTSDPNRVRRRFAQDGDVPVVVLGRSREAEAAQESRVAALETKLQEERAKWQEENKAEMARQAFFEVMNPKATGEGIPEYAKAPVTGGQPPGPPGH